MRKLNLLMMMLMVGLSVSAASADIHEYKFWGVSSNNVGNVLAGQSQCPASHGNGVFRRLG